MSAVRALTSGARTLPAPGAAAAIAAISKRSILAADAIGSIASCGMTPTAACARASAASKSSMRCRRARSSTTARIAALENIGISRGEGASGSVMAIAKKFSGQTHLAHVPAKWLPAHGCVVACGVIDLSWNSPFPPGAGGSKSELRGPAWDRERPQWR